MPARDDAPDRLLECDGSTRITSNLEALLSLMTRLDDLDSIHVTILRGGEQSELLYALE